MLDAKAWNPPNLQSPVFALVHNRSNRARSQTALFKNQHNYYYCEYQSLRFLLTVSFAGLAVCLPDLSVKQVSWPMLCYNISLVGDHACIPSGLLKSGNVLLFGMETVESVKSEETQEQIQPFVEQFPSQHLHWFPHTSAQNFSVWPRRKRVWNMKRFGWIERLHLCLRSCSRYVWRLERPWFQPYWQLVCGLLNQGCCTQDCSRALHLAVPSACLLELGRFTCLNATDFSKYLWAAGYSGLSVKPDFPAPIVVIKIRISWFCTWTSMPTHFHQTWSLSSVVMTASRISNQNVSGKKTKFKNYI